MREVVIILSVHKERGPFRAQDLVDVLNDVRPDAIFLEHSQTEYERFNGLEKKATGLYLVNNQVPVFPCGKPICEKEMLEYYRKHQSLSLIFERYSSGKYRKKYDFHVCREDLEGFSYLHSHEYGQAQKWLHDEEEKIVTSIDREEIYQIFQWCSELQRKRESVICENIEKSVLKNGYGRVALLIGAEHRNSFLGVAKGSGSLEVEWSCYEC